MKRVLCLFFCAAIFGAAMPMRARSETQSIDHPRWKLDKAHALAYQAGAKIRDRRIGEAMGLLGQSRATILSLRERWPEYRRLTMAKEVRVLQVRMKELVKLVQTRGLVEYRGKFYGFEQVRDVLENRNARVQKWLEARQAAQAVQQAQERRMAQQDQALRLIDRQAQQDKVMQRQQTIDKQMQGQQERQKRRNVPEAALTERDKP